MNNVRGCLKRHLTSCFPFVLLLFLLCDPLWFNDLNFTTKEHKGFHKGHKGLLIQPLYYKAPITNRRHLSSLPCVVNYLSSS